MKKVISLILSILLLFSSMVMLFSCTLGNESGDGGDNEHECEIPELLEGENGNWWIGDEDTGIPVDSENLEITKTECVVVKIDGSDYCKVTITLSDGSVREVLTKIPEESSPSEDDNVSEGEIENFITTATITNGYGGANGIVCLMTDNDNGKFETIELLDKLYAKYGLVAGWGTVVRNLYTDTTYTVPKLGIVEKVQEFLDTGRWKIINHSMTHKSYCDVVDGVRIVNEEKLESELVTSLEYLRKLFPSERILTYAMTGTNSAIGTDTDPTDLRAREREVIGENYIGGRFSYTSATAYDALVWNNLPYGILSRGSLESVLRNIDSAAKDGKYYMVYNHYVIEDELLDTVGESSWTNLTTAETLCQRVAQYVNDGSLWNAHFEDAVLYMRERLTASIETSFVNGKIVVVLTDEMDDKTYDHPLTVKLTIPEKWNGVKITQNGVVSYAKAVESNGERYVLANIIPDRGEATIESVPQDKIPEETKPTPKPTPDISVLNPIVPSNTIPDVYTFDTLEGQLGSLINFDNKGKDTNILSIVTEGNNNVLKMEKTSNDGDTMPTLNIAVKTETGASIFVAEMKIKIDHINIEGETYINLMDSNGTEAYRAYIKENPDEPGAFRLTDFREGDSSRASSLNFNITDDYLTLKMVYTVVDGKAVITVYANGDLILTSNNHYKASASPMAADKINIFQINFPRKFLGAVYLDDVILSAKAN